LSLKGAAERVRVGTYSHSADRETTMKVFDPNWYIMDLLEVGSGGGRYQQG
jgi:hypothetical protein